MATKERLIEFGFPKFRVCDLGLAESRIARVEFIFVLLNFNLNQVAEDHFQLFDHFAPTLVSQSSVC